MAERRFQTATAATAALGPLLDRPEPPREEDLSEGVRLAVDCITLPDGRFTNRYRLSWHPPRGHIRLLPVHTTAGDHAAAHPELLAVSTGGFFFLADDCAHRPRCLSLNLAVEDGVVHSLPSADQEALLRQGGALSVAVVAARGALEIDGQRLRWAGSRTPHEAACRVASNADIVVEHISDPDTGRRRTFQPASRMSPPAGVGSTNLGLCRAPDGTFEVITASGGPLDTFQFDLVVRAPRGGVGSRVRIVDIDGHGLAGLSAISVGPSLHCADLSEHPLNRERSLGSTPLLLGRPSSRLVFYSTADGREHLCLLDGRPRSPLCPGVTLRETLDIVHRGADVVTGCFLDSGHTPRISLRLGAVRHNVGNRHYLRWPTVEDPTYLWIPEQGRAVSSLITVG